MYRDEITWDEERRVLIQRTDTPVINIVRVLNGLNCEIKALVMRKLETVCFNHCCFQYELSYSLKGS
jgi:hypothetical protein